jgi:uncharacterized protein YxeA
MKNLLKIFVVVFLTLFAGLTSLAQEEPQQKDSLQVKQEKTESKVNNKDQSTKVSNDKQSEKVENNVKSQSIKQVKGARLDMSKSRGARPPYIERPTGSRIPQGIGKPGGALKPGRK